MVTFGAEKGSHNEVKIVKNRGLERGLRHKGALRGVWGASGMIFDGFGVDLDSFFDVFCYILYFFCWYLSLKVPWCTVYISVDFLVLLPFLSHPI